MITESNKVNFSLYLCLIKVSFILDNFFQFNCLNNPPSLLPVVIPGAVEEVGVRRETELGKEKSDRGKMRVDQRTDAQQALLGK